MELWIDVLEQTARRSGRPLVFGRGNNPINFVSIEDVAALIERVITDPATRALTLETGGPDNLTFNQLAVAVQKSAEREKAPRHVPRLVLWVMANLFGAIRPEIARQGRAALAMDTGSFSFTPAEIHRRYPDLPITSVSDVLARRRE
jgi:NADH dehydrogenase